MKSYKFGDRPNVLAISKTGRGKSAEIMQEAMRMVNDPIAKVIVLYASNKGANE